MLTTSYCITQRQVNVITVDEFRVTVMWRKIYKNFFPMKGSFIAFPELVLHINGPSSFMVCIDSNG